MTLLPCQMDFICETKIMHVKLARIYTTKGHELKQ
jgi:hypothetical protein